MTITDSISTHVTDCALGVTMGYFSDLHLGAAWSPGSAWIESVLDSVDVDVVVFGGDLVDCKSGTAEDVARASSLLKTISDGLGLPLVIVWGNHDAALNLDLELAWVHDHRNIFCPGSTSQAESVRFPSIPVIFHALNVGERNDYRHVIDAYPIAHRQSSPDVAHVGILHTSLTGELSKNPCLPTTPSELRSKNYVAWLLGHVHTPHIVGDKPLIGWPGTGHFWRVTV
ncbi:metallophosphoesterase family protein [Corynebacterium glucuronolyticum]|nr:metallophosphoesterase [Corynebacterium glucuronolyticum]